MALENDKPVALITGSARRIGAEIAKTLHENGFKVLIHYHQSKSEALTLIESLNRIKPNSAYMLAADLGQKQAIEPFMQQAVNAFGRLDLLVNNASIFKPTDIDAPGDWEGLFTTNALAPFWLSLAAFPALKKQHGAIINLTDIHADKPLKGYSLYCQSKAALMMQTKSLALEFAPDVRVNAIAPGAILWPEGENQLSHIRQQEIIAKTPLKRHGAPVFIARAVLSLWQNPFVTGQVLAVDGGRSLR